MRSGPEPTVYIKKQMSPSRISPSDEGIHYAFLPKSSPAKPLRNTPARSVATSKTTMKDMMNCFA